MNCKEVYRDLSGYLDGDLQDERKKEIESHIAACEGCRSYYRTLSEGLRAYRSLPDDRLPDDFYGRLEHSIYRLEEDERLRRSRSSLGSLVRGLSPVLSAGFAFALIVYFMAGDAPNPARLSTPPKGITASFDPPAGTAPAAARTGAFDLARYLEDFVGDHSSGSLSPLRTSPRNVPISVTDPAYATFVSEDPSFSPNGRRSPVDDLLIHTPMGFAAIATRMERPLSRLTQSEDGLLVVDVQFMSKAFVAGLRKGDVIISVDEQPVRQARNILNDIENGHSLAKQIRVVRSGKLVDLRLE
jgi:hypothetical protein